MARGAGVQLPPLRSVDDFIRGRARFMLPDIRELQRWNHRVINNLLYYQTNYLVLVVALLLLLGWVYVTGPRPQTRVTGPRP